MSNRMLYCLFAVALSGCGTHVSSLLLERQAVGPLEEESGVAAAYEWHLNPVPQTLVKNDVEVFVNHASTDYLKIFFRNKEIFGPYAGPSPFYPQNLVFYVKVSNHGTSKILINPNEFVLVDDRGNQYQTLALDYITAFGESRQPMATATRGLLSDAKPGYFGLSVPVGQFVAAKPKGQFALFKQSALQTGYLHPGVVHDGLVAFWNPGVRAKKLRLIVSGIKADFAPTDWPKTSLDYEFEFDTGQSAQ
jgi:hypothetical protein